MPSTPDAAEALRRVSAVGAFFAVDDEPKGVAWQPFSTLLDPYSGALRVGIGATREALAQRSGDAVEDRVAASLWFLGWAARLMSPWLGAAVVGGVVPVAQPSELLWQPGTGQPVPLGLARPWGSAVDPGDPAACAATLYDACVATLVEPLLEATALAMPISRRVLWGNVASATAGAAGQLVRFSGGAAGAALAVAGELLVTGRLEGQGSLRGARFARRTCCLMYRLPDAGLCTDCVLVRRPD